MKVFWPPIFGQGRPRLFYGSLLARFTFHRLAIVWSYVCWSPCAKPGNEVEFRIHGRWVKCRFNLKPFVDQCSCRFKICRRPLVVANTFARLCLTCSIRKIRPLKLRSRRKKVILGPPICRGRGYPTFGHAFSNRTHFRACSQFWLISFQRAPRVAGEKKIDRRRR